MCPDKKRNNAVAKSFIDGLISDRAIRPACNPGYITVGEKCFTIYCHAQVILGEPSESTGTKPGKSIHDCAVKCANSPFGAECQFAQFNTKSGVCTFWWDGGSPDSYAVLYRIRKIDSARWVSNEPCN